MIILFLHGWQSVLGGIKPTYLKDHGHTVINPKLPNDDFDTALAIPQAEFDKHNPDVIVGSSRGGSLAMNLDSGDTPLVLLCPAWKKYGTAKTIKANSTILHSRADDVIPYSESEELVRYSGLPVYTLVETGSDHRLADEESLEIMLEACGMGEDEDDDEDFLGINERPAGAYAGRPCPARGGNGRLNDGLVFWPEQEVGGSRLCGGLSQRYGRGAVSHLERRRLQWQAGLL